MKKFSYYALLSLGVVSFVYLTTKANHQVKTTVTPSTVSVESFSGTSPSFAPQSDTPLNISNKTGKQGDKTIYQLAPSDSRTVFLYGEVGESAVLIAEKIKLLGAQSPEPIYLLINSPGGSVLDGATIISAIEASPAPVYTVCTQLCASMAAIIHQYGKERMMNDRAILMFHNAAGGAQGYIPQILSRIGTINRYVNKMNAYIANRSGANLTDWNARLGDELWLDAEDSIAAHLNDKIVNVVLSPSTAANTNILTSKNSAKEKIDLNWK